MSGEAEKLPEPQALSPFMSVEEAAELLRVNVKTLYKAIDAKQVPCARRIGRNIRINREAFWRWSRGE